MHAHNPLKIGKPVQLETFDSHTYSLNIPPATQFVYHRAGKQINNQTPGAFTYRPIRTHNRPTDRQPCN